MKAKAIDTTSYVPLGAVTGWKRAERGALFEIGGELLRVEVLRADVLRLKISNAGVFDEAPTFAACIDGAGAADFEVEETPGAVTVRTGRLRLVVSLDPFCLDAYRSDGSVVLESHRRASVPEPYRTINDAFVVERKIGRHDAVYGLGEKTGKLDRKGGNYVLWNTDIYEGGATSRAHIDQVEPKQEPAGTTFDPMYTSIPFFYHCRTEEPGAPVAGFFIDNGYRGHFELTEPESLRFIFLGGQYTEYVFAGPAMSDVLEAYTWVTGRMSLPPVWSLGYHQCRWHPYDAAAVVEIAEQYRRRFIPCDAVWLDIDYMDGYRVFTWNPSRYSDPEGLAAALRERRLRLVTIIDPGVKVDPGYTVFDEGRDKNLFCKTASGRTYVGHVWPGRTAFPDFSKPHAREWWGRLNAEHVARGVAGIWNDMNEPATGGIDPFAMRFDRDGANAPHERLHNQYALMMAMGTHHGLLSARPDERPFILSRAGSAGIQRYAAQWMGDNTSSWAHLAMSVPMACGFGLSGQPFVGADIPGFMGKPTGELMVRWMQHGALTPFCRAHNCAGMPDQYPWSFGKAVEDLCRDALELRYRLMPYLYAAFLVASETGAPIQRPLVYDFQDDRQAREAEDQYLLGEALLVAPVLDEGRTQRNVYLPRGTWIEWRTGRPCVGPALVTVDAPIDTIPLFVRGGSVVPMLDKAPASTMDEFPKQIDLLVAIPEEDGQWTSILHEDDGVSHAFRRGDMLKTTMVLARRGDRITIDAKVDGVGFRQLRRTKLRIVLVNGDAGEVMVDGVRVPLVDRRAVFDNAGRDFRVDIAVRQPSHAAPSTLPRR